MDHSAPTTASVEWLSGVRDVTESSVPVVTEAQMARRLRSDGRRVVAHHGRYWVQAPRGFFSPVHPAARLTAREATRPTLACWGFRACLEQADAHHANAVNPMYLVSDLDSLDEESLPASRRYKLNKARRRARLVEVVGPDLLREQGYEVLRSAHERTGYGVLPSREKYQATLDRLGEPAHGIVLAGLVEGRLGGYITGYAVDGTAYVGDVVIATEALNTELSTGLTYEFVYACRRSVGIREMVHGWHAREDPGLCRYKDWLGLALRPIPSRLGMLPGAGALIRRRYPDKYYRLTGRT